MPSTACSVLASILKQCYIEHMNERMSQTNNFARLARYSLMLSVLSLISVITLFPSGLYYGFLCAALGVAGGFLSRPYLQHKGSCTASIIMGIIAMIICGVAFHGIYSLYTMLKDPVAGPQITEFIREVLAQYGMSTETFARIMKP